MTVKGTPAKEHTSASDCQMTGLAGELFVAAELLKRGIQTSITFGNAKAIDLLAVNPETKRTFTVQVKAVRKNNPWPISHAKVHAEHVYVFVMLNEPGKPVEYYVVPRQQIASDPDKFRLREYPTFPGVGRAVLEKLGYAEAWHLFNEPVPV